MEIFDKIEKLMGLKDEEFDEEYDDEVENDFEEEEEGNIEVEPFVSKKPGKIVSINASSSSKVVISKPRGYDEGKVIVDNLKDRRIIIVNLNGLDPKEGQRILDFLVGAIYALAGNIQTVEKGVFILTPSNVDVSSELKNELSNKGIFGSFK